LQSTWKLRDPDWPGLHSDILQDGEKIYLKNVNYGGYVGGPMETTFIIEETCESCDLDCGSC